MKLSKRVIFLGLCLTTSAFAGQKVSTPPDIVVQALEHSQTDRMETIRMLEAALATASPSDRPVLLVWTAEQYRLAKRENQARRLWEAALKESKREEHRQCAQLGLALLTAPRSMDSLTRRHLEDLPANIGIPTQNADRYFLLSKLSLQQQQSGRAQVYLKKALGYAETDLSVLQRLNGSVSGNLVSEENAAEPQDTINEADIALINGDIESAKKLYEMLQTQNLKGEQQLTVDYLARRIQGAPVNKTRIGVILPLSGKYDVVGAQAKDALTFAVNPNESAAIELIFSDSGDSPESAVQAVEDLILKEGVIAVIGPLRTDFSEPVIRAANALRVPTLALTKTIDVTKDRPFVFQSMVNARQYAEALAEYVMTEKGFTKFAIFAPKNAYGVTSAAAFTQAVESRGGQIMIREDYDPTATDLISSAETLGRKDYETRKQEFRLLKANAVKNGGKANRVVLPPTVDFDAIFIPETARRIPIACAALAYEEFSIGLFKPRKNETPLPLLGLASWNHTSLLNNGGKFVQASFFTDIYLAQDEANSSFRDAFRETLGRTPTILDVIVYDTGLFLADVLSKKPQNRLAMRDLFSTHVLEGAVTGNSGFDKQTREANFHIQILTILDDKIFAVRHAEDSQIEEEPKKLDSNP